jgi:hypothetical protein
MSALERTTQDIASRDRGIDAFVLVDVAVETGVEPQGGKGG